MKDLTTELLLYNGQLTHGYINFVDSVVFLIKILIYCAEKSAAEYSVTLSKNLMDHYNRYPGYSKIYDIF